MNKLFRFKVNKDTIMSISMGLLMIALSFLMIPFGGDSIKDTIIAFVLRDLLMIFGLGVVFVSLYVEKNGSKVMEELGLTKRKIIPSIMIDIVLAAGLLAIFLKDQVPENVLSLKTFSEPRTSSQQVSSR